jgi:hypothetical protein
VALIRKGKLTGVELSRRDDEEQWQPLFESRVFRREVPTAGDPREAARLRVVRALGGHFSGFFITAVVMYAVQGHFPFWLAIWGAVLAMQMLGTVPAVLTLMKRRTDLGPAAAGAPARAPARLESPGVAGAPSTIAQEAARVRALIESSGGNAPRLLADVDGIWARTTSRRGADLEDQTSDRGAPRSPRRSPTPGAAGARRPRQDRPCSRRQMGCSRRADAITKAVRVLRQLRVRRGMAEHRLKQLRLDLTRGAASASTPRASSRLQFIRYEVDAREEVSRSPPAPDNAGRDWGRLRVARRPAEEVLRMGRQPGATLDLRGGAAVAPRKVHSDQG